MHTPRLARLAARVAVAAAALASAAPVLAQNEIEPEVRLQPERAQPDVRFEPRRQPAEELPDEPQPADARAAADKGKDNGGKKKRSVAEDTIIRARAGAWFTQLSGQASSGIAFPGTISDIDLIDDLNLDPDQTVFLGSLGINFSKKLHLDLGYAGHFSYEGTSNPIDISFDDLVFSGTIVSDTEFDVFHGELAFDVVEAGPFTVALGFGVRVMDFSATVSGIATDPGSGISAQTTETVDIVVPLPAPGLTVRWDVTKRLYLRGVLRGIYAGDYGNFFDAVGEVGFDITRNIGLYGGYRWMHGEADVSDVAFEVDLEGLYAGVEVRF